MEPRTGCKGQTSALLTLDDSHYLERLNQSAWKLFSSAPSTALQHRS